MSDLPIKESIIKTEFETIMKTIRNTQDNSDLCDCQCYLNSSAQRFVDEIKTLLTSKNYDVFIVDGHRLDISWYYD